MDKKKAAVLGRATAALATAKAAEKKATKVASFTW